MKPVILSNHTIIAAGPKPPSNFGMPRTDDDKQASKCNRTHGNWQLEGELRTNNDGKKNWEEQMAAKTKPKLTMTPEH